MTKEKPSADQLITTMISGIEEVKGKEITILDLREIENTVCDYFIVCEGTSNTQVNAIVNSIQKQVSKILKDKPEEKTMEELKENDFNLNIPLYVEKIIEDSLPSVEEAMADLKQAWQASLDAEEKFKKVLEKFVQ